MLKWIKVLLILVLVSACTSEVKPIVKDPVIFPDPVGSVSSADTASYAFKNQYIVEQIEEHDGLFQVYRDRFSGFKSKVVEAKVNEAIAFKIDSFKKYLEVANFPNYRGFFRTHDMASFEILGVYASTNVTYSKNNILSMQVGCSIEFKDKNSAISSFISISDALNFDLNTGNQIGLSDLFINGYDFVSPINDLIYQRVQSHYEGEGDGLNDFYSPFIIIDAFEGIQLNQAFYLYDNSLSFIFDEKNPEFTNEYGAFAIPIPLEPLKAALAFNQRFYTEGSTLFESSTVGKVFFQVESQVVSSQTKVIKSKNVKSSIYAHATSDPVYNTILTNRITNDYNDLIEPLVNSFTQSVDHVVYANKYGKYFTIDTYLSIFQTVGDDKYINYGATYNPDGTKIGFDDVFKSDFDYETLIRNEIRTSLGGGIILPDVVDSIYNHLSIILENEVMVLTTNGTYPSNEISFYVFYKDHLDHLKIFD